MNGAMVKHQIQNATSGGIFWNYRIEVGSSQTLVGCFI